MHTASAPNRRGVALPEVLVAAVLLGIGVAGCLGAVSTALRFRAMATTRETIAAAAQVRLTWFEVLGCTVPDTILESGPGVRPQERWTLQRDPATARLDGAVTAEHAGRPMRLALVTTKRCD